MEIFKDIEEDNIENVKNYILSQQDINARYKKNFTLLMYAAKLNKIEIFKLLIEHKADTTITDGAPYYRTAFYLAVKAGSDDEIVDTLYQPEKLSKAERNVALIHYAYVGKPEKVKECIEKYKCDINFNDMNLGTPLIAAAKNNQLDVMQLLLSYPGIDVNKTDDFNNSPLILAALEGHAAAVELFLLQAPINLHLQSHLHGTALTAAVWEQHTEIVKTLLIREGSFDGTKHPAAFLFAVRKDNVEIAKLLLSYGADVNSIGNEGYILPPGWIDNCTRTSAFLNWEVRFDLPLTIALEKGSLKVLSLLLECGADFNKRGAFGRTPADVTVSAEIEKIIAPYKKEPVEASAAVSPKR